MHWQQFLNGIFLGDPTTIGHVQRLMGYIFSGSKELQIIPVIHGTGRNGKTTFIDAIGQAMCHESRRCGSYVFDTHGIGRARPDLADLEGIKMAVFTAGEARPQSASEISVRLKALASDEEITARGLYQPAPMTFRNTATPVLVVNEIPDAFFRDKALGKRGVFIPFNARFAGRRGRPLRFNPFVVRSWIREGMASWQNYDLTIPKTFQLAALGKKAA
ncbi:DUF5906 domain-containing protein [Solidesulfovibrio sp.]